MGVGLLENEDVASHVQANRKQWISGNGKANPQEHGEKKQFGG
jgi:hypothetical protein